MTSIKQLILIVAIMASVLVNCAPTAAVREGFLIGTTTSLPAATATTNKFLGIPYAKSPPTRFAAPSAADSSCETRNATAFGPACLQQSGPLSAFSYKEALQSEDCLYLNVWQPGGPPPEGGWPVMVWIHGGGLQFGSGDVPEYDGVAFAAYEDILFVSFNYRLSFFGFPGAPGIPNIGFLDQRFALSWVQDNIDAFNGDPAKVTIFGESSGGVSVSSILEVPPAPLTFRAAIIQSGTALSNGVGSIGINPETVWNETVAAFNCSAAVDQLNCMRLVPAHDLQAYASNNSLTTTIKNDGTTYVAKSGQLYKSGKAAKVPVMVGSTANEGTIFTLGQKNLTAFVEKNFGVLPSLVQKIKFAYAVGTPGIDSESDAIAQIFTEVGLQCPSAVLAQQVTEAGNPAWRYIYNATFPNTTPVAGINLGVYHSSELPMVFGTYNKTTADAREYALSNYMRSAWARFGRNPAGGPGWGATGVFNGTDLGILGLDGSSGVTMVPRMGVDARCPLYELIYGLFD